MSTKYSATLVNNSKVCGSVCIYQTNPGQEKDNDLYSLAWFSKPCHPDTQITFTWTLEYSFVWSETGKLKPGVIFGASAVQDADPSDTDLNSVGFFHDEYGYHFDKTDEQARRGNLGIYCGNVPNLEASIGIGMSGYGTFACPALANYNFTFEPHPHYWVTFGDFKQGEVMDINRVTHDALELIFEPNTFDVYATLNSNNRWVRTK